MDTLDWLLSWHLFPYYLALALATLWSILQVSLGLVPDGIDADVDVDADADIDLDLDVDTDVDVDLDADADADADMDAGHDWPGGARFASDVMAFFGVGKAPLSMLALIFLFLFGSLGLMLNVMFKTALSVVLIGWVLQVVVFAGVFLVAAFLTGRLARILNRFLPHSETTSAGGNKLVGNEGTAETTINESGGQVRVSSGWVNAVTFPGEKPIQKGTRVMLIAYDSEHFWYTVEPM